MTQYFHKSYGEVQVTPQSIAMQKSMSRRGMSSSSMLVEHKGSLLEVSKDLVTKVVDGVKV
jgi:hypothetical protein